ncbi:hypothetical protein ACFE04_023169 [Oxalis oulophora]
MNDLMTKSFQSYVELKKQTVQDLASDQQQQDLEIGNPSDDQTLSLFFEEVASIKKDMEDITNLLVDLHELNEQTKSTTSAKVLRGIKDRMNSDMVAILRKAKTIKSRLEPLDKCETKNAIDRTKVAVTYGLRVKLRDTMQDLRSLREKIVSDHKVGVQRMYFNATGEYPSEETVEKMILKGGQQEKLFEGKNDLVMEDEERNLVYKNMQRSLTELHQLFLDMAVMVDTQGEKINDIEGNVTRAGAYISGGTNRLFYANQMKKKKTTWVCLAVVLLVIALLVCFFSILVS